MVATISTIRRAVRFRVGVDHPIDLVGAGVGMTIRAVKAQIVRNDSHRANEVVDGELLERAGRDVLEDSPAFFPCGDAVICACAAVRTTDATPPSHTTANPATASRHQNFILFLRKSARCCPAVSSKSPDAAMQAARAANCASSAPTRYRTCEVLRLAIPPQRDIIARANGCRVLDVLGRGLAGRRVIPDHNFS